MNEDNSLIGMALNTKYKKLSIFTTCLIWYFTPAEFTIVYQVQTHHSNPKLARLHVGWAQEYN